MKKKILMVYPEFPTTYWSMKHAIKFVKKKSGIIPLGLLTVAALLPEEYSITLIDMNVNKLTECEIKDADMVFISAMIVQKPSFDKVVSMCNQLRVPVVAGGPYPTSSHKKITGVDHFVLNEAEITLPPFIHDYEQGTPKSLYLNTEKPDITKTPPPQFDLIDFKDYNNIALQNSRGCPFSCEFCDIIELFGRVPRFKDSNQFINEMNLVYKQGFRGSLFVVDDNFIGNKKKVKKLLRGIVEWQQENNYPFSLFTEASIDLADDDELLQLMVDAGFDMVFVGIETPDTESLKSCSKNQNLNIDLYKSITKIQKFGIEVTGGFIVGFDKDTEDIFDRQIGFIQKSGIPTAMVGILGVLPNTRLFRRLKEEGRLKKSNDFSGSSTHTLQMSFVPVMAEQKIIDGYKKILSEIYNPKKYFDRCFTFLQKFPVDKIKSKRPITLLTIRAFFLSIFKQSFSKYSFSYLRFLWRVLIYKSKHFPLAIEHAIKGHHFFIITEDIFKADELSIQIEKAKQMLNDTFTSLISKTEPQSYEILKSIKILTKYRKKLEKNYLQLSQEIQLYLHEQFDYYMTISNTYISQIKELHILLDTHS